MPYVGKPEIALLSYYKSIGYKGVSCEGIGIQTILKALMLRKLAQYNQLSSRQYACTGYLEGQLKVLEDKVDEIIFSIHSVSEIEFIKNFKEIISQPFTSVDYSEFSLDFAVAMYNAISKNIYISVAKKFAEDPYTYRSGWPDLTLVKGKEVLFVEVKTKDKLHNSQIVTIPSMRDVTPFSFKVCKLVRH